jgi:adenylate cyclase class IV
LNKESRKKSEIGDPVKSSLGQEFEMDLEHRKEFRKILGELGFKIENSTKDSNQLYIFNARLISEEEVDDEE